MCWDGRLQQSERIRWPRHTTPPFFFTVDSRLRRKGGCWSLDMFDVTYLGGERAESALGKFLGLLLTLLVLTFTLRSARGDAEG